jgi:tripartite-type tricarboxylate transporter receptor subunit TctC
VASAPLLLVVPPGAGHDGAAGFVAATRAQGDRLAYGMSGVGASPHLAMTLLARAAGFAPTEVVFRGDPEIFAALLSGQIGAAFVLAPTAIALVREGRLAALGTTSGARLPALPAVPTMAEAGWPEVTLASWWGLVAPRGTPAPVVERLAASVRPALGAPGFGARLAAAGAEVLDLGPAPFAAFMAEERRRLLAIYAAMGLGAG